MPPLTLVPRGFIAGVADRIARAAQATSRRLHAKGTRTFPAAPWFATDYVSGATWMPRDTTAFAREGFMQNAIVYRCVRMIAEAAGSIPFCLYDGQQEIEDHPLLALLKAPTPTSTRAEFMESLIGHLLVSGNAYVEAIAAGSDIRELHILRPDRVTLVPGEDGWPEAYDYTVAGTVPVRLDGDVVPSIRRVLHQKLFHPLDDHYGLSPIEAAATAIDIHNSAARWNKALLDNSARPSGALVYTSRDGNLTSEQYQRLKSELEAGFQGAGNAGRPLLLEGGLDWKTMSMSPKDLDFIEAKHAAAREIALALGVPPMLLGIPGDNTFSNYQEANRTFWRSTVLPLTQRLVSGLSTWLTPAYGASLRLDIDQDDLPALSAERDDLWKRIGAATFLTSAEKRAAAGYGAGEPNEPLEPKFNPGQPRKPSGRPGGGQWTKPGGDGGAGPSANDDDGAPTDPFDDGGVGDISDGDAPATPSIGDNTDEPQDIADRSGRPYSVQEEDAKGGHTYERHINKSDEYLIGRITGEKIEVPYIVTLGEKRAGSFSSLEAANKLINSTMSDPLNHQKAEEFGSGSWKYLYPDLYLFKHFDSITGKEAYAPNDRQQPIIQPTYDVTVRLRRSKTDPRGYYIESAWPNNEDK